jgi:hypothetical protein
MPLAPGAYIAEEVAPSIGESGQIIPATGGAAVGSSGGGGGGGAGGGEHHAPRRLAQQHHIQPTAAHQPPASQQPSRHEVGHVPQPFHPHPTGALDPPWHRHAAFAAPATGASANPRPRTYADGNRHLLDHVGGRTPPVRPIPNYLLPGPASRARMRQGFGYFERQLGALDRSLKRDLGGRTLKPFQVAALVGSMSWESHTAGTRKYFDPHRPGVGGAFGLAGWGGSRLTGLETFALGGGHHSVSDLLAHPNLFGEELRYAVHELSTPGSAGYRSAFEALVRTKTLGGAHGAEAIVEQQYEKNYDRYQVGPNAPHTPSDTASYWYRLQLAQYALSHFGR